MQNEKCRIGNWNGGAIRGCRWILRLEAEVFRGFPAQRDAFQGRTRLACLESFCEDSPPSASFTLHSAFFILHFPSPMSVSLPPAAISFPPSGATVIRLEKGLEVIL